MKFFAFLVVSMLMLSGCSSDDGKKDTVKSETQLKKEKHNKPVFTTPPMKSSILNVTPQTKNVRVSKREIVFQFANEVVPLGKMDRKSEDINIKITPQVKCEYRWLNRSTLVCRLPRETELLPATKYTIEIPKHPSKVDNFELDAEQKKSFTTVLPRINGGYIQAWQTPQKPYAYIYTNLPVTAEEIAKKIYFSDEDANVVGVELYNYKSDEGFTKQAADKTLKKEWYLLPKKTLGVHNHIVLAYDGLEVPQGHIRGESGKVFDAYTFNTFHFKTIDCYKNRSGKCDPMESIQLLFNTPVSVKELQKHIHITPKLTKDKKKYNPWENMSEYHYINWGNNRRNIEYKIWMPRAFKAATTYTIRLDRDLKDYFGRKLGEDVSFKIVLGHRDSRVVMPHTNVVLEKGVDSAVPLYVTNIKKLTMKYQTLFADGKFSYGSKNIPLLNVKDVSYKLKLGARNVLQFKSGVMHASVTTPQIKRYNHELFIQVTPFSVHSKMGHFSSLIWVSDFATGKPVENAKVILYKGNENSLDSLQKTGISGVTDKDGCVQFPGLKDIDPEVSHFGWYSEDKQRFFVKVVKKDDVALLPLTYDYKLYSSGVYGSNRRYLQHSQIWGTTAQGIYKPGSKIEYKIYVRNQNNDGYILPDKRDRFTLEIQDPMGKVVYKRTNLKLDAYGTLKGHYKLAKNCAVGTYGFYVTQQSWHQAKKYERELVAMRTLVSDFTPAPFSVTTQLNGKQFKKGDTLKVTTLAKMFSGGAYADAPTRINVQVVAQSFKADTPELKDFNFGDDNYNSITAFNVSEKLNKQGENLQNVKLDYNDIAYGNIIVESSVKDERGKYIAAMSSAKYFGSDRFVGLKMTKWIYKQGEDSIIKIALVDQNSKMVAGEKVDINITTTQYKSARVKGAGNVFVTRTTKKQINDGGCSLVSTGEIGECHFIPHHTGYYQVTARIKDSYGNTHKVQESFYVTGSSYALWDDTNDATLQIVPEKQTYKEGDVARYMIKNPYPGAKALVTIERYGVLDSWVQTLKTSTPIIEVPVKKSYAPGYYLSVTVVSPRVDKPVKDGNVDLGKPSYKMGYVKTDVLQSSKILHINVTTDKKEYEPAQKAVVNIKVTGKPVGAKQYQLAVAILDESVFALNSKGMNYYNPYKGFYSLSTLDVINYSLISRLIGRQNFEKKGANQGGDGGGSIDATRLRDNFKYLAYWNPNIVTDKQGKAQFSVKLPDNLTGWRVIVLAVDKKDKMGVGVTKFRTTQKTIIKSVLPNQVSVRDKFQAGFTVYNRTDKKRTLDTTILLSNKKKKIDEKQLQITIEPYGRKNVYLPVEAKKKGTLIFDVTARDNVGSDRVLAKLQVHENTPVDTMANFGTTKGDASEEVLFPQDILDGSAKVSVALSSSVIGNVDGALKYIRDYPYWCWEQRLSKGVGAAYFKQLRTYLKDEVVWDGAKTLTQKMINDVTSFQAPNGGMCFWLPQNRYVSPYLSAYTALEFAWLKKHGYKIPQRVENRLNAYLKELLEQDNFPDYYSQESRNSLRSVVLNALAQKNEIDAEDVMRFYRYYDSMSLFAKTQYLSAMLKVAKDKRKEKLEAFHKLLNYASQSAAKYQFVENESSIYWFMLGSPMRNNCSALSTMLVAKQDKDLAKLVGDIPPKLVRTITQERGHKDHWENTQENTMCMRALVDYAKMYEGEKVAMDVTVDLDNKSLGSVKFSKKDATAKELSMQVPSTIFGEKSTLKIHKKGSGRLYYTAKISYASKAKLDNKVNSGIAIAREYYIKRNGVFEPLSNHAHIKQGDVIKVELYIDADAEKNYVVVEDPVAGGLEPINLALATSSAVDAADSKTNRAQDSWYWRYKDNLIGYGEYYGGFYHKELRHDSARFYADYLSPGHYYLSYTLQAIASGEFQVMPVVAQEMYDEDVYGRSEAASFTIDAQ